MFKYNHVKTMYGLLCSKTKEKLTNYVKNLMVNYVIKIIKFSVFMLALDTTDNEIISSC